LTEKIDIVLGRTIIESPLKKKDLQGDFAKEATDDESEGSIDT